MSEERYLIWSYEHGGWWGPSRDGYVWEFGKAGRYTGAEAREIILEANRYAVEQKEVMVAEEDVEKFEAARGATPIVDDSEMLRAYAETLRLKDAEIERLKKAYDSSQATVLKYWEQRTSDRKLMARAADALEESYQPMWSNQECHAHSKLIAELRHAAG